ncbi:MAG: hydrolase 2, exosortase A system-associated [Steroidobacteraceae bacterium]|nr:hydrolase 2, exosortase A system-associated [Steroidobacteraceae bacterium]MDW8260046.1 hydrolase 2, exosortase A system-associated [Gammaproteobacteria bacterium]
MSPLAISGHFIDGPKGKLFVLLQRPPYRPSRSVLVVPPFAEEMNKCRRMIAAVGFHLAERGLATVVPDLYGTGDSGGDFTDADWDTWRGDVATVASWCQASGYVVSGLLAIRLGAALAAAALQSGDLPKVSRTVLWQPVFDGGKFLTHFLRLRIAATMQEGRIETSKDLRARLAAGEALEVAGYGLTPRLAADLESVKAQKHLPDGFGTLQWIELSRDVNATSAAAPQLNDSTPAPKQSQNAIRVRGAPFWSTTEIVVNREVVAMTVGHLCQ